MGDSWLPEQKPFWVDLTECCGQYPHVCRAGLQESRNQGSWAVLPTVGICMHGATSLPTSQGCPEDPRDKQAESPECVKLHLMESVSPAYSRGASWDTGKEARRQKNGRAVLCPWPLQFCSSILCVWLWKACQQRPRLCAQCSAYGHQQLLH